MRKFGVEVEGYSLHTMEAFAQAVTKETGVPLNIRGWQRASTSPDSFILTTDGSVQADELKTKGWEIVSPPLTSETVGDLEKILKCIRSKKIFGKDIFKTNKTCSVHVHIDRTGLNKTQLLKIFTLYGNIEEELNLMFPISRRNNTARNGLSYCGPIQNIMFKNAFENSHHSLKYYSLHFPKGVPTIEFRIHGATTNFQKIMSWVKIINEIIDFALTADDIFDVRVKDILSEESYNYYCQRVKSLNND